MYVRAACAYYAARAQRAGNAVLCFPCAPPTPREHGAFPQHLMACCRAAPRRNGGSARAGEGRIKKSRFSFFHFFGFAPPFFFFSGLHT